MIFAPLQTQAPHRRHRDGFTLLETLLAVALLALLSAMTATTVGVSRRSSAAGDLQAQRGQVRSAAEAILATEGRRAGYVSGEWDEDLESPFGGLPPVEIELAGAGDDTLLIRYHDEQFRRELEEVTATFSAGRDGAGRPNLYRRLGTASRQPALEGIDGFDVVALYRAGVRSPPVAGVWSDVAGVAIEVSFAWDERLELVIVFGTHLEVVVR